MNKKIKIVLFIPIYNVENEIIPVLDSISTETLNKFEKVFIIDNKSTDSTVQVVITYLEKRAKKKIQLFQNKKNIYLGGSTINAFDKCIALNIDYLVCMHGDGQASAKDLRKFIDAIRSDAQSDFILESRFLKESNISEYSTLRIIVNIFFSYLQWLVLKQKVYDLGAFIGFNIKTIQEIDFKSIPWDMGYHPYLILVISKKIQRKLKFVEFPISWGEVRATNINIMKYGITHLGRVIGLLFGVIASNKSPNQRHVDTRLH